MERPDIKSMNLPELEALLGTMGEPSFRARQIFRWLHHERVGSFGEMTNLSAALRGRLDESCYINALTERRRQTASDGTVKFLFSLRDGNAVESVLMRHDYGDSLCISTQVGCKMGCKFCASTIGGKLRDLTASELLDQIYCACALTGRHIDSVVMMGIGEPLDNLQNVLRFLELVHDPAGLGLSHRHISLSTCGLVDRIDELAGHRLQLTLSVSLHASDDKTRSAIMPVNRKFPIALLLDACKRYFAATGRRISYEYALISGVNDSPAQAAQLAALLRDQSCHVNLILINPVKETDFSRGSRAEAERFRDLLIGAGLSATIRRELGTEIDAACGQLRRNDAKEESCRVDDR